MLIDDGINLRNRNRKVDENETNLTLEVPKSGFGFVEIVCFLFLFYV